MNDKEIFLTSYPEGCMVVHIGEFFGTVNKKKFKKWLDIARRNCTDKQRSELIMKLHAECGRREDILRQISELENKRSKLLSRYFSSGTERPSGSPEKQLMKQCEKMKYCIDTMEKEKRWRG